MQPLTPRRILGVCALLAGALFVSWSYRCGMGAYPI